MKYLATIKYQNSSSSMSFNRQSDAENWINENNNNLENISYIDIFDDDWIKVDSYFYTEAK